MPDTSTTCTICHRPDPTGTYACAACQATLRATLTELTAQMPLMRASLHPGASPRTGTTTGGRATAPLPVRLDVLSLLGPAAPAPAAVRGHPDDQSGRPPLLAVLRYWAYAAADGQGKPRTRARTVEAFTHDLADRLPWICHQPGVTRFAAELQALLHRVRAITQTEPRTHPRLAPCLCGAFGLTETDWSDVIICTICDRRMTRSDYHEHATTVLAPLYRPGVFTTTEPGADHVA